MRSLVVAGLLLVFSQLLSPVSAQTAPAATPLTRLEALQQACRASEQQGRRRLYAVELTRFSFAPYDAAAGKLEVAAERNLRLFGGSAELFTAELEPITFTAGSERAAVLRRVASAGATLRLGFFLAFDRPTRRACLIRPAVGVTTVRADLA
ncbi:MAG: hypothetical protein GXP55_08515, partial [Deltaproteobacteria bacterium]|nr:hypothetical protein [Deltaproteobacteria bacterium]